MTRRAAGLATGKCIVCALAVACVAWAALSSCGLNVVGIAEDASASLDADSVVDGEDAGVPEPDAGRLRCGDRFVPTCAGCKEGAAACHATGTCVSDCLQQCDDASIGCATCSAGIAGGSCEPTTSASCIDNPTYEHCACVTAADCPGANQVCVLSTCRSCGEPMTDDEVCRSGTGMKKCKVTDPKPENRFRCR